MDLNEKLKEDSANTPILKYFCYDSKPEYEHRVRSIFARAACEVMVTGANGAERQVALWHLLDAMNAQLRAAGLA